MPTRPPHTWGGFGSAPAGPAHRWAGASGRGAQMWPWGYGAPWDQLCVRAPGTCSGKTRVPAAAPSPLQLLPPHSPPHRPHPSCNSPPALLSNPRSPPPLSVLLFPAASSPASPHLVSLAGLPAPEHICSHTIPRQSLGGNGLAGQTWHLLLGGSGLDLTISAWALTFLAAVPPTHTLARVHPAQVEQQHQASSVPWVLGRLPHPAGGENSYCTVGPGASSQPIDFSLKLPGSPRCPRTTLALPAIVRPPTTPLQMGMEAPGEARSRGAEVTSLPSGEDCPPHTHPGGESF